MKKRILAVGVVLVAAGAAGGIGWHYFYGSQAVSSNASPVYVSTVSSITGAVTGNTNRYAGVVEPQETVEVTIESGRTVKEVNVKVGQEVKQGQLLFEYDLSSIQEDLQQARLDLDRLKNEALSLTDQIATLEKEKKQASKDNQLSYTIEIETNKMNLKKNEYSQQSKQAEITKLENATGNTEVRSEIDGIIQKIDTSKMNTDDSDIMEDDYYMDSGSSSDSDAFITILSTGAYRVKGQVNELEAQTFFEGEPIIVRSRIDETQIWRGTLDSVDRDNAISDNSSDMYWGMVDTGSSQTTSSSYPFYVELDSSENLMLGQHVYIERDNGQEDQREGLWLSEFYIVDADDEDPYVWAANDKNKLEKRSVILGNYDEDLCEYEIVEGLTLKDYIAYPTENLEEGMPTTTSESALENMDDSGSEDVISMDGFDDAEMLEDYDAFDEEFLEDDYIEDDFTGEEYMEDFSEDEEMIEPDFSGETFDEELMTLDEYNEEFGDDMMMDEEFTTEDLE